MLVRFKNFCAQQNQGRVAIAIAVLMVLLLSSAILLSGCSSPKAEAPTMTISEAAMTLDGTWTTEDGLMTAVIGGMSVDITLTLDDSSGLYWSGSMPSVPPSDGALIISEGDTDAMALSLFGSQDEIKEFIYKDGELTFSFTMMEVTQTIHLVQTS